MKNVVSFKLSRVFALLNSSISQKLQSAFAPFDDDAECYCIDVCNIKSNGRGRDYKHSPLAKIQGSKKGIFVIFAEGIKKVLCVGSSETQDFFPSKANGGSSASGVVRYINGDNPRIELFRNGNSLTSSAAYAQYINGYSIFFLCLKPAPNASTNFATDLDNLKTALENILHPTI